MENEALKPITESQAFMLKALETTVFDVPMACSMTLTAKATHYVWLRNNREYAKRVDELWNKLKGDANLRALIRDKNELISKLMAENHQLRAANAQGIRINPNQKKYWEMSKEELYADIQADFDYDEVVDGEMLEARPEVPLEEILAQIQPLTDSERERIAQVWENQ